MEFGARDLISINDILADVLLDVGDESMKLRTPGFYQAQVKYAMNELSFDTLFIEETTDIVMPTDMFVEIPAGVFNIREVYVYSGTPDEIKYMENVYWKRRFKSRGFEKGYTANVKSGNTTDPFISAPILETNPYYFNVQRGFIMLSDPCSGYDYIRVVYNSIQASGNILDAKIIPPFARKAVTLWVVEKAARSLKVKEPKYRQIQIEAATQLDEYGLTGAWQEAKRRLKRLDTKKYHDLVEYNSKILY
jgi:hypothetical protein